jgi:hypothetical protein
MSVDYDNRERKFNANIQGCFKELASDVAVQAEQIRETMVLAYRVDLVELDQKARVMDDLIAIVKTSRVSADIPDDEMWRKVRQLLEGKGLI